MHLVDFTDLHHELEPDATVINRIEPLSTQIMQRLLELKQTFPGQMLCIATHGGNLPVVCEMLKSLQAKVICAHLEQNLNTSLVIAWTLPVSG